MDSIIHFMQTVPNNTVLPQPAIWIQSVVIAVLSGWSALLAHKAIANFHDGVRPIFPELMAGRMSRTDLASAALKLSLPFIIGFGLPFSLASGLVMVSLVLLPAEVLGIRLARGWIAFCAGVLWGLFAVLLTQSIFWLAAVMPINFVTPLQAIQLPVAYGLVAFPALAVALQFGPRLGIGALLLTAASYQGVAYATGQPGIPEVIGMIVGVLCLLGLAFTRDQKTSSTSSTSSSGLSFTDQVIRIRRHLPWLVVQGALLALASRLWILSGSEADFALLAGGRVGQAALSNLLRGLAFMPLIAISALSTGVYQAAGFTFVYVVGVLSPHPLIALFAGGAIIIAEVFALEKLNTLWQRFPSLREASEHLRGSLAQVLEVALLVGSALAANQLLPNGLGLMIFVALYVMNTVAGQVVYRMAAGPLIVLIIGLVANILTVLGF